MCISKTRKISSIIISAMLMCCLALTFSISTFAASNNVDTNFNFSFAGAKDNTVGRPKYNSTDVYMKVKEISTKNVSFTAHEVGMTGASKSGTLTDCSRGYSYTVSAPGVWRMRNWVYDGNPSYKYAGIYAAPTYGYSFSATGVWSPDSV